MSRFARCEHKSLQFPKCLTETLGLSALKGLSNQNDSVILLWLKRSTQLRSTFHGK